MKIIESQIKQFLVTSIEEHRLDNREPYETKWNHFQNDLVQEFLQALENFQYTRTVAFQSRQAYQQYRVDSSRKLNDLK